MSVTDFIVFAVAAVVGVLVLMACEAVAEYINAKKEARAVEIRRVEAAALEALRVEAAHRLAAQTQLRESASMARREMIAAAHQVMLAQDYRDRLNQSDG